MRKLFLGIAVFTMMLVLCIASAGAESYDDFLINYEEGDDEASLWWYAGDSKNVVIPSVIDGKKITYIEYGAFENNHNVVSVTIPGTVTELGNNIFGNCTSLKSVTIPDSVKIIGDTVFYGCTSLKSVTIPDSVEHVGKNAFRNTALLNSQTTDVKYVGDWVVGCDEEVKTVSIKSGAEKIAAGVFSECDKLTQVTMPATMKNICSSAFSGCEALTSVKLNEGLESIGDYAFLNCNKLLSIKIPESVTSIGKAALGFMRDWLEGLTTYTTNNKFFVVNCYEGTAGQEYAEYWCFKTGIISKGDTKVISGFRTVKNTASSVTLSWDKNSSLDKYWIWRYIEDKGTPTIVDGYLETNDNSRWELLAFVDGNTTSYTVTGLSEMTSHIFCIEGYGIENYHYTSNSEVAVTTGNTLVRSVSGFSLGTRSSNSLSLRWNKNASADGYILEQYKGGKWTRIARIAGRTNTSYNVTGLASGTAYKFRIRAYKIRNSESFYSAYTALAVRTNPSDVSGLKLGGRTSNALRLNWTKNTSADGYIIEQYKNGSWVRIARIAGNDMVTYRISGLAASTQYKFRIKAYKMSGSTALYSGYSSLSAYTNPSAVSGLKIAGKATTALRLGWSKNVSADGYIVEMYSGGKWVRVARLAGNEATTCRKTNLSSGTTYKFRVRTYNMVGKTALYGAYVTISGTTL